MNFGITRHHHRSPLKYHTSVKHSSSATKISNVFETICIVLRQFSLALFPFGYTFFSSVCLFDAQPLVSDLHLFSSLCVCVFFYFKSFLSSFQIFYRGAIFAFIYLSYTWIFIPFRMPLLWLLCFFSFKHLCCVLCCCCCCCSFPLILSLFVCCMLYEQEQNYVTLCSNGSAFLIEGKERNRAKSVECIYKGKFRTFTM